MTCCLSFWLKLIIQVKIREPVDNKILLKILFLPSSSRFHSKLCYSHFRLVVLQHGRQPDILRHPRHLDILVNKYKPHCHFDYRNQTCIRIRPILWIIFKGRLRDPSIILNLGPTFQIRFLNFNPRNINASKPLSHKT